jgi:transmembrane sensor
MHPKHQAIIEDQVLQEASTWFAILQSDNISREDQQKWREWLSQCPANQLAWEQIESIQAEFNQAANSSTSQYVIKQTPSRFFASKTTSLFSAVLVIIVSLLTFSFFTPFYSEMDKRHFQTAVGETRLIHLADGTQLWLNTNSSVDTQFSADLRQIILNNGEIFISSGQDKEYHHRPLVVDTKDGRLTALGTRFNVRYENNKTSLSVFEGSVKTAPSQQPTAVITQAGEQTIFNQQKILTNSMPVDPVNEAWTNGILLANDMPLCDFVTELNRYQEEIIICPNELNTLRLMGSYPLNNIPRVLTAVEHSLPVHIWQVNKKIWRIDKTR